LYLQDERDAIRSLDLLYRRVEVSDVAVPLYPYKFEYSDIPPFLPISSLVCDGIIRNRNLNVDRDSKERSNSCHEFAQ
jgi:hypothetical protein